MPNYNSCTVIGTLVRDPDVKFLANEKAVCNITVAINERYKSGGEQKEDTVFLDVEVWGRQAEICGEYLSKGSHALFDGRLRQDNWEAKDGSKRSKIKLVAQTMQMLDKPTSSGSAQRAPAPQPKPEVLKPSYDDDLDQPPF